MQQEQCRLELFGAEPMQLELTGGRLKTSSMGLEVLSTSNYPELQPVMEVSHEPSGDTGSKRQGSGTLTCFLRFSV